MLRLRGRAGYPAAVARHLVDHVDVENVRTFKVPAEGACCFDRRLRAHEHSSVTERVLRQVF